MKKLLSIGLLALVHLSSQAFLQFWDTNGAEPGCGGSQPTGTWGVDPYWSQDDNAGNLGVQATAAWPDGNYAVFCAGNEAFGAYSIHVYGTIQVADIHVDSGQVTFDSAPGSTGVLLLKDWNNVVDNRRLSVGHKDANAVARYEVPLTGANNLIRYKRGTLILAATNSYTGSTIIEGGVLQLGVSYAIPSDNPLMLANNDTTIADFDPAWQYTPAVFDAAGHSQRFGPLLLSGTDSGVERRIDFGNGASSLAFADSSGQDWGAFTLNLVNYTPGANSLRFGTSANGLTPAQLGKLRFIGLANAPGRIDAAGYVTPALPAITQVSRLNHTVTLMWSAFSGRSYRVYFRDDLVSGTWNTLGDVTATGDTATTTDPNATPGQRFYRVELLDCCN